MAIIYIPLLRQEVSMSSCLMDSVLPQGFLRLLSSVGLYINHLIAVLLHTPNQSLCPTRVTQIVTGQLST